MELVKYEHACFTVEKDGQLLVVDPGNFSGDFIAPADVVAVVFTHEHADHFDRDQLASIIDKNPDAIIVAHPSITNQIEVFQTRSINAGDRITIGPFDLEFFGGEHALIHAGIPAIANLGVMVNDLLYYPGDSFALPSDRSVDTLAIPAAAPWMKMSEAMDYLAAVRPRFAFPTHDAILSSEGQALADRLLGIVAEQNNIDYRRLDGPIQI
jgi:L-ascorbate metabolism protein UlaG (beta-lactamase superfamily)